MLIILCGKRFFLTKIQHVPDTEHLLWDGHFICYVLAADPGPSFRGSVLANEQGHRSTLRQVSGVGIRQSQSSGWFMIILPRRARSFFYSLRPPRAPRLDFWGDLGQKCGGEQSQDGKPSKPEEDVLVRGKLRDAALVQVKLEQHAAKR